MKGKGEYKVFVSNQVAKLRKHSYLEWYCVPTKNNPADLGSRGCELRKLCEFWRDGSEWLGDCKNNKYKIERKKVRELIATTVDLQNQIDTLLNKFTLSKTLRILSWINCFLNNCSKSKVSGPLTAEKV